MKNQNPPVKQTTMEPEPTENVTNPKSIEEYLELIAPLPHTTCGAGYLKLSK